MGRVPALKIRSQRRLSPFSREYSCLEGEVLSAAPPPAQGEGAAGKGQEAAAGAIPAAGNAESLESHPKTAPGAFLGAEGAAGKGIGG